MKKYLFFIVLCSQFAFSQNKLVEDVIQNLKNGEKNWQVPLSDKQTTNGVVWQERKSSLAFEGIRTFVGYVENKMTGVVSIYQNAVSGSLFWLGKNYVISSQKGKISISEEKEQGGCGTCEGGHCMAQRHLPKAQALHRTSPLIQALTSGKKISSIIPSDDVLRTYRLAILVDYSAVSTYFKGSRDKVKAFWAEVEVFLNEAYLRDVGVKFTIVNDERLIISEETKRKYRADLSSQSIMAWSTGEINGILGDGDYEKGRKQYDAGVSIAVPNGNSARGIATLAGVYKNATKGAVFADAFAFTISHELGHLFGADHTFTIGGQDTFQTEPERGTSMMSYGQYEDKGNFFSLFSISQIRKEMVKHPYYYANKERTTIVGEPSEEANIVYGEKTNNTAPIISRKNLKNNYQLPVETSFQFDLKASDPEGKALIYWVHQTDPKHRKSGQSNKTKFYSHKPQGENIVRFDPQYYTNLVNFTNKLKDYTQFKSSDKGEYTFWVGVADNDAINPNHKTRLDAMAVTVEIINGTPFKLTSKVGNLDNKGNETRKYNGGQKTTLTWSVDKAIFGENSRVRILMSDDFGKSWKYVLNPDTENDGTEEIVIPNIDLSERITHEKLGAKTATSGKGLFRIEVLDHIATAMTDGGAKPVNGGFEIHPSKIQFTEKPQSVVQIKRKDLPLEVFPLKATTSCSAKSEVKITSEDKQQNNRITRTWTAQDDCGNTAYFVQHIEIKENTPALAWELNPLPEVKIACEKDLHSVEKPKTMGGEGNITITFEDTQTSDYCEASIKRTYTAKDEENTVITIEQTIKIKDETPPTFVGELPKDLTIAQGDAIPEQADLTATDNCGVAWVEKYQEREYATSALEENTQNEEWTGGKTWYVGNANPENKPNFFHSFEEVLQVAQKGDRVILLSDVTMNRTGYTQYSDGSVKALDLPSLFIDGNGFKLHIPVRPISLLGNVTFRNINLSLQPLMSLQDSFGSLGNQGVVEGFQYVYLNGHRLVFDQVNTKVEGQNEKTRPIIIMGAEKGKTDAGKVQFIVKNADKTKGETQIKAIVAGSLDTHKTTDSYIELGADTKVLDEVFFQKNQPMSGKVTLVNRSTGVMNINATGTKNEVILENVNYGFRTPTLQGIENLTLKGNTNLTQKDLHISGRLSLSKESTMEVTDGYFSDDDIFFSVGSIKSDDATLKLGDSVVFSLTGNIEGTLNVHTTQKADSFEKSPSSNAVVSPTSTGYTISDKERKPKKVIYKWVATDDCGNQTTHTQTITIEPKNEEESANSTDGDDEKPSTDDTSTGVDNEKPSTDDTSTGVDNEKPSTDDTSTGVDDEKPSTDDTSIGVDNEKPADDDTSTGVDNEKPADDTSTGVDNENPVNDDASTGVDNENPVNDDASTGVDNEKPADDGVSTGADDEKPKNEHQMEEVIVYNGVSTQAGSENYFRLNDNTMLKEEISVEIFNEMGQRVYKNDNYGKNGEVFRGYANEKGVFRREKPLPQGTYFYILKFNKGSLPNKVGYLFVK